MDCSNCHQPLENGAAFCGNCGHPVASSAQFQSLNKSNTTISNALTAAHQIDAAEITSIGAPMVSAATGNSNLPAYAVPLAGQQRDHMRAAVALVCGILSLIGSLFMPLIGVVLAICGIILGTMSRRYAKHTIGLVSILISSLGLVAGIASWVYVVSHDPRIAQKDTSNKTNNSAIVSANAVSTPCYEVSLPRQLHVQNPSGSCNMNAFDGENLDTSTTAYKVFATTAAVTNAAFAELAKSALEKDITSSAPDFTISKETVGTFSGNPAYIVTATNGKGVTLMEAAVLHSNTGDNNLFVLVYATTDKIVNLQSFEKGWQWK